MFFLWIVLMNPCVSGIYPLLMLSSYLCYRRTSACMGICTVTEKTCRWFQQNQLIWKWLLVPAEYSYCFTTGRTMLAFILWMASVVLVIIVNFTWFFKMMTRGASIRTWYARRHYLSRVRGRKYRILEIPCENSWVGREKKNPWEWLKVEAQALWSESCFMQE